MKTTRRTDRIDLRIDPKAKEALQAAATLRHKTVSEFVLENAMSAAEEVLAERRNFGLNAEQWEAFQVALDASPRPMPRLERLMREQGFFDESESES